MTDTITLPREVVMQALEALKAALSDDQPYIAQCKSAITDLRAAIEAAKGVEPVAWQAHVEQKLLTWRQSFINKSGDQLALDDFMDKRSIDDLIDFVCDEYAYVAPPADAKDAAMYKQVCNLWIDPETKEYVVDHCEHPIAECTPAYIRSDKAMESK